MMELLRFMFSGPFMFLGCLILLGTLGTILVEFTKALRGGQATPPAEKPWTPD